MNIFDLQSLINYKKYKWKYLMSKLKTSIYVLIRFNSGSMLRDDNRRENYVARKKREIMIFVCDRFSYLLI